MPTEPQSQPLVSIIVPVYNAADHIARCIESIRRQTYRMSVMPSARAMPVLTAALW